MTILLVCEGRIPELFQAEEIAPTVINLN